MLNVGIVGYGNVGKSVEKQIGRYENLKLIKVFSSRDVPNCENIANILNYVGKIDLLFLCVGSKSDLEKIACGLVENFNLIDCYDNHNRLSEYMENIGKLATISKKVSFVGMGWDPGLFSLIRAMCNALGCEPYTFWGKGTSQGHTQALKTIEGVKDAIQFTVPNKKAIKQIKKGLKFNGELHWRLCYIVCDKEKREYIKNQIINMPDYFKGYKVKVKFVAQKRLNKLKTYSHKGEIIAGSEMYFSLKLASNPDFTARVMLGFATLTEKYINEKKWGCFSILNIPLIDVLKGGQKCL